MTFTEGRANFALIDASISAFLQAALLGGLLFFDIWVTSGGVTSAFSENHQGAGLQIGAPSYLVYSLAVSDMEGVFNTQLYRIILSINAA